MLTEKQIQYGFTYFFIDEPITTKRVVETSEYSGETELIINCTQLNSSYKAKDKKRILSEWCELLNEEKGKFKKLTFGTRMPQELFDAVCEQTNLEELEIKWGVYKDLSKIENLNKLKLLHIGSGSGVESIDPISTLAGLEALSVENFQKINDYTALSKMKSLESLSIQGDGLSPQYIKVTNLNFLHELTQLRFFRLLTTRLKEKDYSPVLSLKNLEHLTLRSEKEVKKLYPELIKLPKLKWGLLKDKPELYES